MKILAISGSTRKDSYNTHLLQAFVDVVSEIDSGVEVKLITLNHIPMFNQDLEHSLPSEITELIKNATEASGIIISTPEYGNMIPGVVKNATEWLSRSYSSDSIKDKPLAIAGASTGGFGTVRAQNQLLLLGMILKMRVSASLRLPISNAKDVFDENWALVDADVRLKLETFAKDFISFIRKS